MTKREALIEKAKSKVAAQSTETLCQSYELLNGQHEDETPMVRGWIMDELESRNPEAFDRWIDCEDLALIETPSAFFC